MSASPSKLATRSAGSTNRFSKFDIPTSSRVTFKSAVSATTNSAPANWLCCSVAFRTNKSTRASPLALTRKSRSKSLKKVDPVVRRPTINISSISADTDPLLFSIVRLVLETSDPPPSSTMLVPLRTRLPQTFDNTRPLAGVGEKRGSSKIMVELVRLKLVTSRTVKRCALTRFKLTFSAFMNRIPSPPLTSLCSSPSPNTVNEPVVFSRNIEPRGVCARLLETESKDSISTSAWVSTIRITPAPLKLVSRTVKLPRLSASKPKQSGQEMLKPKT